MKSYIEAVRRDTTNRMVELKTFIKDLRYDLCYASLNNFMHKRLYSQDQTTFMRLAPASALKFVQEELNKQGFGLKIFDAYRPYRVTKKMWKLIHDERYVADPSKGSGHNRGVAVDLTLIDLKTGEELNMGTGFDNFTDTAHQGFKSLPEQVLKNRTLLRETMTRHGFSVLETEWWHYAWPNSKGYDVLDLSFKQLARFSD